MYCFLQIPVMLNVTLGIKGIIKVFNVFSLLVRLLEGYCAKASHVLARCSLHLPQWSFEIDNGTSLFRYQCKPFHITLGGGHGWALHYGHHTDLSGSLRLTCER